METVLKNAIKKQIEELKGIEFQSFIDKLYIKFYGDKFVPVKPKRDKGNDGILHGNTVLAVYSPEKYELNKFKTKIENDYEIYAENWANKYPNWQVIFNGEWTAGMVEFVEALKSDSQKVGIKHILEKIDGLNWGKRREIADDLGVDDQFLIYDILTKVIDDLLKRGDDNSTNKLENIPGKVKYIKEKIELNYSSVDIEAATDEYADCLRLFNRIKDIVQGYDDDDKGALKNKIRSGYNRFPSGNFKDKLERLTELYAERHKNDDLYKFHVKVVLIYFFEQCLIGEKTEEERNAAASS